MSNFFDIKARAAAAAAAGGSGALAGSSSKAPESNQLQPWVEKYRPKTLNDVAAQDHTINVLQRTLQASNLPHMLFYGPPGTGKTSTILALAKELFGPELFRSRVLELNASDERGISVVREKIKDFARAQLSTVPAASSGSNSGSNARARRHPCPPFKLIVLDEADSMTQDAQAALRRTMETYSRLTRFCLVCNYVTRIIDPLASRCSKFRFKSLDRGSARTRLAEIAAAERVPLGRGGGGDDEAAGAVLDTLIRCSDGDLRKAITFLQSAARLVGAVKPQRSSGGNEGSGDAGGGSGAAAKGKRVVVQDSDAMDVDERDVSPQAPAVTVKIVEEIAGVIPTETIEALVQAMRPRAKGTVYEAVSNVVTDMVADGWSGTQVVSQLYQEIIFSELIPDKQKNKILLVFSEVDKRLVDGADEHLQILDLALRISNILAGA